MRTRLTAFLLSAGFALITAGSAAAAGNLGTQSNAQKTASG